jgi:1-deoxy-D-xylulose-5-phosphate reductoisomerase
MVEFCDNSVMAQLSIPDMRFCVQYAVNYPDRKAAVTERMDFRKAMTLTFDTPDYDAFPLLGAAYDAVSAGGAVPCLLNAANEVAVAAFLCERINYRDISTVVISTVKHFESEAACATSLDEIIGFDKLGREYAESLIK